MVLIIAIVWSVPFALASPNTPSPDLVQTLRPGIECFDEAYCAWNLAGFKHAADIFQAACASHPDSYEACYWLGAARFHVFLHRERDAERPANRAELKQLSHQAEVPLVRAIELNSADSESRALLGTLAGIRISLSPWMAISLGKKVTAYKEAAQRNEPANPRNYFLIGTSYFHAPGILGGQDKALDSLLKAEQLFMAEAGMDPQPLKPAWGYGACLTFIARTYQRMAKDSEAAEYFRKALAVNPQDLQAREGLKKLGVRTGKSEAQHGKL